jgi:TRAP transporter TAXI family solute receptor
MAGLKASDLPLRRTRHKALLRRRRHWMIGAGLLLAALLAWAVHAAMQPARNRAVVFTAGAEGGIYMTFAKRYAEALRPEGITLDIRRSSGAVENYERLKSPDSDVDIGLVQSGTGNARDAPMLQTLASVSYEPIWIFYRGSQEIDRLSQLAGKRIGVGQPGSGLRTVMLSLLAMHEVGAANATITETGATASAQALLEGKLDAAAFIGAPDIPHISMLLKSDLRLMSMSQADTVVRRFPSLAKVVFPRGAIDLARDRPPQDVTLLSTTALLVARKSLHTEVAYQLLDAASEIHGQPSFFADRGDFPNQKTEDFPISDENRRYFKSGRPFLQNYLPFWLANFIEQRFVYLVPSVAVFFALLQTLPRLYAYRMRSRLARWYQEIRLLEAEVGATPAPEYTQLLAWQDELEEIDASVGRLQVPEAFIRDLYALKHAIHLVAERMRQLEGVPMREIARS